MAPREARKTQATVAAMRLWLTEVDEGTPLPSWGEMAETYGVSNATLTKALDLLTDEGLIERFGASGRRKAARHAPFPRNESDHAVVHGAERGQDVAVRRAGREPWHDVLRIGDVPASVEAAQWLEVEIGTPVLERVRRHGVIDLDRRIPVMLSWTWLSTAMTEALPILREESTGRGGMSSRFEDLGLQIHWKLTVSARLASQTEMEEFSLPAAAAVLDAWRGCYDQDERILEVTRRVIDPRWEYLYFEYASADQPKS